MNGLHHQNPRDRRADRHQVQVPLGALKPEALLFDVELKPADGGELRVVEPLPLVQVLLVASPLFLEHQAEPFDLDSRPHRRRLEVEFGFVNGGLGLADLLFLSFPAHFERRCQHPHVGFVHGHVGPVLVQPQRHVQPVEGSHLIALADERT